MYVQSNTKIGQKNYKYKIVTNKIKRPIVYEKIFNSIKKKFKCKQYIYHFSDEKRIERFIITSSKTSIQISKTCHTGSQKMSFSLLFITAKKGKGN